MNGIGCAALVDTGRDELRERIAVAQHRFDRLARVADRLARPPKSEWTVQQVVAHVLTVARRYQAVAEQRAYRRAERPRDLKTINQVEIDEAMAPLPVLVDGLRELTSPLNDFFDGLTDDRPMFEFHGGALISGLTAQTNWLGELLLHGHDMARAVGEPWELDERDMLLVARGLMQIGSGYLRAGLSARTDICVAIIVPEARPYLIHIHDGIGELRARRSDDRPDAVLRLPASILTQLLYQRIGPFTAARRGMLIMGGRRPWRSFKLQSCFEPA